MNNKNNFINIKYLLNKNKNKIGDLKLFKPLFN